MKQIIASSILLLIVFGFSACSKKSAYVQCYEAMLTDETYLTFGRENTSAYFCRRGIMSEADLRLCLDKVGTPKRHYEWGDYNRCLQE